MGKVSFKAAQMQGPRPVYFRNRYRERYQIAPRREE